MVEEGGARVSLFGRGFEDWRGLGVNVGCSVGIESSLRSDMAGVEESDFDPSAFSDG